MRAEMTETSVKLIAENNFERQVLSRLKKQGVDSIKFENEWDQNGALILEHGKHPWDIPNSPGGR